MKSILIGVSSALLLIACSKEEVKQRIEEPRLMNTWETPCSNDAVAWLPGLAVRSYIEFSGDKFTEVQKVFSDDSCTTAAAEGTASGTFVLGDVDQASQTRSVDLTYEKSSVLVHDQNVVTVFNTASVCGISDWAAGVPRDVTTNSNQATCLARNAPSAGYDILRVVNENQLLMGSPGFESRSSNSSERPTELDTEKPYTPSQASLE